MGLERWWPAQESAGTEWVFYDGHCALCHGMVSFVLTHDHRVRPFQFAPLQSRTFHDLVPAQMRGPLPDSVVVRTAEGSLLTRGTAVLWIGERLGGPWRALAAVFRFVPRPLLDIAYDAVARIRRHLFATPDTTCPLMPPHLRSRFHE
jgi:predicted DCC family thiol-disulfide oxidoreductase YuxK